MMAEVSVAPTFRMSRELQNLSGDTTLWLVCLNLDLLSGYTIWGGDDPDRFLTVDGRLVIAPSMSGLLAVLPPAGRHPFAGDERFTTFCRRIREIDLVDDDGEDDSGLYDFRATLTALREREVLDAPHSGMAIDCLGAAMDLGRQYGEDSLGFQLARYGPLDTLYHVIWGNESEDRLDYLECEAAFVRLVDWIEDLARQN
jgi:hypothetical protein